MKAPAGFGAALAKRLSPVTYARKGTQMNASESEHLNVVRQQFRAQATDFDRQVGSPGYDYILAWILDSLELRPSLSVLDVAAGTGLMGLAIAPRVQTVVALDATPEMLEQGRRRAMDEGISNIVFEEGDAQRLPYPDDSFELITCRIGMHHFQEPRIQVLEMVRVCRPGGQVAIIDIVSSEDPVVASFHNRLERLRDPSHTRALGGGELAGIIEECGLENLRTTEIDADRILTEWLNLTDAASADRRKIIEAMEKELNGGPATGMRPFWRDGELTFRHTWEMVVGVKQVG